MEQVTFYSSLAYNVLLHKLNMRNWYDRIDSNVVLGALPFRGRFSRKLIEDENVRAVISMNHDYELRPFSPNTDEWKRLGVEFAQFPTKDYVEVPSLANLHKGVELIERFADSAASVYIHCKAGRTRSATLVACYLLKKNNLSVNEAVKFIRSKRPHVYLTRNHLDTISLFEKSLQK